METAIHTLIDAVLLALVTLAVFGLKTLTTVTIIWLQSKIGDTNTTMLKGLADTVVRFLAQSPAFEALELDEKKEYAITWLTQKCEELKLPFTHDDIDKFIEEAVQIYKSEMGPAI